MLSVPSKVVVRGGDVDVPPCDDRGYHTHYDSYDPTNEYSNECCNCLHYCSGNGLHYNSQNIIHWKQRLHRYTQCVTHVYYKNYMDPVPEFQQNIYANYM